MVYSSTRVISLSRNELTATNLAREGIEAIRNIVESNKLRCGKSNPDAWRLVDSSSLCTGTYLSDGLENYYRVYLYTGSEFEWVLASTSSSSVYGVSDYKLTLSTMIPSSNGIKYYTYNGAGGDSSPVFYRQIKITYDDKFPAIADGTNDTLVVTSTVAWLQGGRTATVDLTTYVN